MRPALACALILLAVQSGISQATEPPPARQRQTTYPFSASGGGLTDLQVSPSGSAYVAGVTSTQGPFISRVGPDGTLSWLIYESDLPLAAGFQGGLAVDSDDNVYRIYTDYTSIFGEIVVVKYSSAGVRLQETRPASSNPGSSIIANGLTLDSARGNLYASMDFLDTNFETAVLVVQLNLNLVESARNVYRGQTPGIPESSLGAHVVGGMHISPSGKASVSVREQDQASGYVQTRSLFLRYDTGLVNRVEEFLPPSVLLGTTQSEPVGGMFGVIFPSVPTFPPSFPVYQQVAPTFGPQRPAPGGLIGVGPQAETYWRLGSRQIQKIAASGNTVWSTPIVTDAGKDEAEYARVSNSALFLAGSFIASGQRRVYLDRYGQATDSLSVVLEPAGVAPGAKTQVQVTLKDSQGNPVADRDVTFTAEPVANSGGHDHGGSRPAGAFSGSNILFSSPPHGRTGPDGKLAAIYTASKFGGQEKIMVHVTTAPSISTSTLLEVKVPGLVLLPGSANYGKVGGTSFHLGPPDSAVDHNHYGATDVISILPSIAIDYAARFQSRSVIQYNDISLPSGGLFDVGGQWLPPHDTHRTGREVDIRSSPPHANAVPSRGRDFIKFSEIAMRWAENARIEVHSRGTPHEHIHIYF